MFCDPAPRAYLLDHSSDKKTQTICLLQKYLLFYLST